MGEEGMSDSESEGVAEVGEVRTEPVDADDDEDVLLLVLAVELRGTTAEAIIV